MQNFQEGELVMENGNITYEILRAYGDKHRVLLDIAAPDYAFTREMMDRLARQLARELANTNNVIVNIFNSRHSISTGSHIKRLTTNSKVVRVISDWHARYIRSREIGLHQLTIYLGSRQLLPQVIRYS